ncbi:hypothetical protein AB833_05255 [Chromatiales bacterium (ex Bugula neritina AB1)]|nr:hypothetical protein AB833_05255 [Chromatiales bacterium (ex Bugula neritina AB1)]
MHNAVPSNLPAPSVPLNWAVTAPTDGKIMYAAHLSIGEDGQFVDGTIEEQTRQAMNNIKASVEAAGGTMADIAQCLIYLVDAADASGMNAVYGEYFDGVLPNRATVVVAAILVPEAKVEIVAYAHIAGT